MKASFLITIVAALALTLPACSKPTVESPDTDTYGKTITPDWHVPEKDRDKPEEFKPLDK